MPIEEITLEQWLHFVLGLGGIIFFFFILPPYIDNWEQRNAK